MADPRKFFSNSTTTFLPIVRWVLAGYDYLPEGKRCHVAALGTVGHYWLRGAVSARMRQPVGVRMGWPVLPRPLSSTS